MYTRGVRALAVVLLLAGCEDGMFVPTPDAAPVAGGTIRATSSVGLQPPFSGLAATFGDSGCTSFSVNECTVTRCPAARAARAPQVADGGVEADALPPPIDGGIPGDGGPIPDAGSGDGGLLPDAGGDAGPVPAGTAGTITLTGGSRPIVLEPDDQGLYPAAPLPDSPLWLGGESLRFSAAGAEVPAFQTVLTAPGEITIVEPAVGGGDLTLSRDAGLGLIWLGGQLGFTVVLGISTPTVALSCSYPADSGSALVSPVALANLPLFGEGELSITVEDRDRVSLPGWRIDVSAASFASLGDGSAAVVPVVFAR
jgi:hypothetical protein